MQDDEYIVFADQLCLGSELEREQAVHVIANSGYERAAIYLARCFNHELSDTVRKAIADALLAMGPKGAEAVAKAFMSQHVWDEPEVRYRLTSLMLKFGDLTVDALLSVITPSDVNWQSTEVELLGQLGDARAIEPLLNLLTHPEVKVQVRLARILAQLKAVQAIEPLKQFLNDDRIYVRDAARKALEQLEQIAANTSS